MADEAQQKQRLGLLPTSSERKALAKVVKTKVQNQQARQLKDDIKMEAIGHPIMNMTPAKTNMVPNLSNMNTNMENRGKQVGGFVIPNAPDFLPPESVISVNRRATTPQRMRQQSSLRLAQSKEDLLTKW